MKEVINFLKKYSIFIIILILWSFIIAYLAVRYMYNEPKDPITSLVSEKVETFKDELQKENDRVATNKSERISGISREQYFELLSRYNIKKTEFEAFTNVNATLRDSLNVAMIKIDELNNKVWNWENKKPSGSVIKATMNEKDSVLHTSIDVKLNVTDVVEKGGLFKKDKIYTDFYSPDQNIKVNGVQNFRKEVIIKPKRLGIGLQAGYGITGEFKTTPYIGVGVSYNLFNL